MKGGGGYSGEGKGGWKGGEGRGGGYSGEGKGGWKGGEGRGRVLRGGEGGLEGG